jgi:hypothetical protein
MERKIESYNRVISIILEGKNRVRDSIREG